MSGRARGRTRGHARGVVEEQRLGEDNHRPPVQPVAAQRGDQEGPPASGRAAYRGGAREPRPGVAAGDGMAAPVEELARLNIGGAERDQGAVGGAAGGVPAPGGAQADQPRRRGRYEEPLTRPAHITDKTGTVGNPLPLMTNYFRLEQGHDWHLYQYRVEFSPDLESKRMRIALLFQHEQLIGRTKAFDGMVLYLPIRLQNPVTEVYSVRNLDNQRVRITIKLTNELPPTSPQCIQVYNIIFRRLLAIIDMKQIGRNYYNPSLAVDIPQHKLKVMPGFVTSILQYENSVLLNCDIVHKILRSDTVLDMMYDLYERVGQERFYDECTKKLVGSTILTRYSNKTYRVDDIDWNTFPHNTFRRKDGSEISYIDYFRQHYGIELQDHDQPMLVSKPSTKDRRRGMTSNLLFPPEQCTLTGLSEDVRADFHVMQDVAAHTRVPPDGRQRTLKGFIEQLNRHEQVRQEMGDWNMQWSDSLVQLNARVLPKEKISTASGDLAYRQEEADWSKDMRGKKMVTPVNLNDWLVVFFRRQAADTQSFVQALSRVGPPMGMEFGQPRLIELNNDRNESFLGALRENLTPDTQMVMCVVPTNKKDRYDAIKKFACVDHPVPSQVIVARTLSKKQMMMSVATKVAIQLNCKLGGEVWITEIPLRSLMVIGYDTYHDSAKKGQSVGGFIASINKNLTRYYSKVTFQSRHQELLDGIQVCYRGALDKYYKTNGSLPERIIVYRDGVGDGQLGAVYEHEVPQMLEAFKKAGGPEYNPKVGFLVVKKRINSRFFARTGANLTNPPPGTVIDNTVTKPEWYDFFLVSQSVRQGTVTPTHYNIIHDTTGLRPDHMQRLTYKLCHLYYNWPGTIRVPAPCQYAHKLAFLVGQSIHRDPAPELSDRLFFL